MQLPTSSPKAASRLLDASQFQSSEPKVFGSLLRTGGCTLGCGGCCEQLVLPLDPRYMKTTWWEDFVGWIELHGITVYEKEPGRPMAFIRIPCSELQEDKSCGLWGKEERPDMCSNSPDGLSEMDIIGEFCTYKFEDAKDEEFSRRAIKLVIEVHKETISRLKKEIEDDTARTSSR